MSTDRKFGWKPDLPDQRDKMLLAVTHGRLPSVADIGDGGPVLDQGALGACTGFALASTDAFLVLKERKEAFAPSPLFIYYNERLREGSVNIDAGASLRDGVKVLVKQGACSESMWPYIIAKFADAPSPAAYADAMRNTIAEYRRIPRVLSALKRCVADGYPFVFGFTVYDSFMDYKVETGGIVPMPALNESLLGGHAVWAKGYDVSVKCPGATTSGAFRCRNSWSADWGIGGEFWLPFDYFLKSGLSGDFWTLRKTKSA